VRKAHAEHEALGVIKTPSLTKKHAEVQTKTENLVSLENGNGMLH